MIGIIRRMGRLGLNKEVPAMRTLLTTTVLTAALGLSACDSPPPAWSALTATEPLPVATAAVAEEETYASLIDEYLLSYEQLCDQLLVVAQMAYQGRLQGIDQQRLLATIEAADAELKDSSAMDIMRELAGMAYDLGPQYLTPELPAFIAAWSKVRCYIAYAPKLNEDGTVSFPK